ncbi:unnamed protein product [Trichogramma brassicae]|uniref:Uncharacterized protein n=1 Tax=Trichogramma brassicae TaxID=86971 RepID=A0A6H5IVD8_9HYME|nr:unnamed protein product [Trichogramma brassicae]
MFKNYPRKSNDIIRVYQQVRSNQPELPTSNYPKCVIRREIFQKRIKVQGFRPFWSLTFQGFEPYGGKIARQVPVPSDREARDRVQGMAVRGSSAAHGLEARRRRRWRRSRCQRYVTQTRAQRQSRVHRQRSFDSTHSTGQEVEGRSRPLGVLDARLEGLQEVPRGRARRVGARVHLPVRTRGQDDRQAGPQGLHDVLRRQGGAGNFHGRRGREHRFGGSAANHEVAVSRVPERHPDESMGPAARRPAQFQLLQGLEREDHARVLDRQQSRQLRHERRWLISILQCSNPLKPV